MKNIVRKILSIFLLVSLVGVSSVFWYETDNNVLNNLQFEEKVLEYKNSLKNNLSSSEYKEFENKFNQLTKKQKEELLNLVNNPKKILYLLSKDNYNDGKINISTIYKVNNNLSTSRSSSSLKYGKATTLKNLDIFGINLVRIISWVEYYHNGDFVTEIIGTHSGVDHNWTLLTDYRFTSPSKRIEDGIAIYTIQVTLVISHKNFGVDAVTAKMGVIGSAFGKIGEWWEPRK